MRKHIALMVLALIAATAIGAWAGGDADGAASEKFSYDFATSNQHWRDPDVNLSKLWFDEHYNVDTVWIPTENQLEALNVLLAAGDIPDMISLRFTIANLVSYADQGVLAELPLSTISQHMPEYKQLIESWNDPLVWKYGEVDGKHMGLPIISPWNFYREGVAWNAEWLLRVGINKVPETIAEFEAAFLKFRNEDPNQSGSKDTYGFTAAGGHEAAPRQGKTSGFFQDVFGAFGVEPFEFVERNGKLVYGLADPGGKEALGLLAEWYQKEIIDPEWVTDPWRDVGVNDVGWKFANERIGYIAQYGGDDYEWDGGGHVNAKWHSTFPEHRKYFLTDPSCWPECGGKYYYDTIAFDEVRADRFGNDYHPYVTARPPLGPRGERGMQAEGTKPFYIGFGRQLEDNEPKYTRLLEILNEIGTDRTRYYQAALGCFVDEDPPTEACADWPVFEWVPFSHPQSQYDDKFQGTEEWSNDPRREGLGGNAAGGFSTNPFWVYAKWYQVSRGESGLQRQQVYDNYAGSDVNFRPLKVALPSQAQYADSEKILIEGFYEVILGERSINDWDSIVSEWMRAGGEVLTREANEWWDSVN